MAASRARQSLLSVGPNMRAVRPTRIISPPAPRREQLGRVRANSAVELLLDLLSEVPVITVDSAVRLIGRQAMPTGEAVNRLEGACVLRQRNVARQRRGVLQSSRHPRPVHWSGTSPRQPDGDTASAAPTRRGLGRISPSQPPSPTPPSDTSPSPTATSSFQPTGLPSPNTQSRSTPRPSNTRNRHRSRDRNSISASNLSVPPAKLGLGHTSLPRNLT